MQRILSLDLARGFTVLFIPIVHSVMIYGSPEVHTSTLGDILGFIAEWPGAQVFMLAMGISFELSTPKSFGRILGRSMTLVTVGYFMNFLKFVVPYFMGGLPGKLLYDLHSDGWVSLLLIGDILQFAGISLLILWCVQKAPDRILVALLLAMFVCFASPFPFSANSHVVDLATGGPPKVFFPLFPWLVYPLAGVVIGNSIKAYGSKIFVFLLAIGAGLMLAAFCAEIATEASSFASAQDDPSTSSGQTSFYVTGPWDTLMHLGFVLVWLAGFHFLSKLRWNAVFKTLQWMSKNITLIYFIQWPLIFWMMPVIGYQRLNTICSVVIGIDVALVTWLIVLIVRYVIASRRSQ
ncbi:MAG TPA: heparan-alpha-glucosaminide N-acetyltransferase domain-containing protein [Chlamydiales bacterium]|jgi:hypothetical protein|nr:heparan-alpha-glucosaminide N-acetyltransferase domain-containing protein [Chlamydiales bacterium]